MYQRSFWSCNSKNIPFYDIHPEVCIRWSLSSIITNRIDQLINTTQHRQLMWLPVDGINVERPGSQECRLLSVRYHFSLARSFSVFVLVTWQNDVISCFSQLRKLARRKGNKLYFIEDCIYFRNICFIKLLSDVVRMSIAMRVQCSDSE